MDAASAIASDGFSLIKAKPDVNRNRPDVCPVRLFLL